MDCLLVQTQMKEVIRRALGDLISLESSVIKSGFMIELDVAFRWFSVLKMTKDSYYSHNL